MDPRTLEVTVLSAEDLRVDKKPVKKNAFVVIKTDALTQKSTKADYSGGSYPYWNEKLTVPMPAGCRFLALEVRCRMGRGGDHDDRVVGSASVPVSDFLGGWAPEGYLHFLSYRLRDSAGRKNGIINFSVRVGGGGGSYGYGSCGKSYNEGCCSSSSSVPGWKPMPVTAVGLPATGERGQGSSWDGGVVMGIPVCSGK